MAEIEELNFIVKNQKEQIIKLKERIKYLESLGKFKEKYLLERLANQYETINTLLKRNKEKQ